MKVRFNLRAIMLYAHSLRKRVRNADMKWALAKAWENAKYIAEYTIKSCKQTSYKCSFPMVEAEGVTWKTHSPEPWMDWVQKYGAE